MAAEQLRCIVIILSLTLISGMGDAMGFVHSARVWQEDKPVWTEFAKSAAGFAIGISTYWFALRYLNRVGEFAPEAQTLAWFVVTIIGIAMVSRAFFAWQVSEQIVAVSIVGSIGWLLLRTGG